jgi:hypothetical protein
VRPEIGCGRFPIKRVIGERVVVTADLHADGHDVVCAVLLHRAPWQTEWQEVKMQPLVNDRWTASFSVSELGRHFLNGSSQARSVYPNHAAHIFRIRRRVRTERDFDYFL